MSHCYNCLLYLFFEEAKLGLLCLSQYEDSSVNEGVEKKPHILSFTTSQWKQGFKYLLIRMWFCDKLNEKSHASTCPHFTCSLFYWILLTLVLVEPVQSLVRFHPTSTCDERVGSLVGWNLTLHGHGYAFQVLMTVDFSVAMYLPSCYFNK